MPIPAQVAFLEIFKSGRLPLGTGPLEVLMPQYQFRVDVAYWYGTLCNPGSLWKKDFLFRMWALIWHGGLWMRTSEDAAWRGWERTNIPIAACLSHGGRVLVQLLPDHTGTQVWNWLWGNQPPESRWAGTHGVKFGYFGDMPDGRPKRAQETKSGQSGTHYGINIAGGGAGNKNPVSGKIIADDGRHGHLYICFIPPTAAEYGAILFGAEDSAPIDRADTHANQVVGGALGNTVGLGFSIVDLLTGAGTLRQPLSPGLRAAFPRGQTGAYHAFGVSGEYSLTGGKKFKNMAKMNLPVPSGNDQMFVNPPRRLWEDLCASRLPFNINDLGDVPPPLAPGVAKVMPKSKHFYEETAIGAFHRRNENLRAMDELLKAYETNLSEAERATLLRNFVAYGRQYIQTTTDPPATKAKVASYIELASELF